MEYLKNIFGLLEYGRVNRKGVEEALLEDAIAWITSDDHLGNGQYRMHFDNQVQPRIIGSAQDEYKIEHKYLDNWDTQDSISIDTTQQINPLRNVGFYNDEYKAGVTDFLYNGLAQNGVEIPREIIGIVLQFLPFNAPYQFQNQCVHTFDGKYTCPISLPNGYLVAIDTEHNVISLMDHELGHNIMTLYPPNADDVFNQLFKLPRNRLMVTSYSHNDNHSFGKIMIYNYLTGELESTIPMGRDYARFVKLSQRLFAALVRRQLQNNDYEWKEIDVLDTVRGQSTRTIDIPDNVADFAKISSEQKLLAVSTRKRILSSENTIGLYNWETGQQIRTFGNAAYPVLLPLNNRLLLAGGGLHLENSYPHSIDVMSVWDCSNGKLLKIISPTNRFSNKGDLFFTYPQFKKLPNGLIALGFKNRDFTIVIDLKTGECKKCLDFSVACTLPHGRLVGKEKDADFPCKNGGQLKIWQ
jgi:hypothetical protein